MAEGTVLDAHDGQLAAEGQLKWEAVQVGVVVEVQLLQVLQCAWGQTSGTVSLDTNCERDMNDTTPDAVAHFWFLSELYVPVNRNYEKVTESQSGLLK